MQQNKLHNRLRDKKTQHDPKKIIFNYSRYALSDVEDSLLWKGVNFSIPPKKLHHSHYFVNFQLFYRDICNLQVLSTGDLDFIKTKTKDIALFSFRIYNNNVPQHLSKGGFDALKISKQTIRHSKI